MWCMITCVIGVLLLRFTFGISPSRRWNKPCVPIFFTSVLQGPPIQTAYTMGLVCFPHATLGLGFSVTIFVVCHLLHCNLLFPVFPSSNTLGETFPRDVFRVWACEVDFGSSKCFKSVTAHGTFMWLYNPIVCTKSPPLTPPPLPLPPPLPPPHHCLPLAHTVHTARCSAARTTQCCARHSALQRAA